LAEQWARSLAVSPEELELIIFSDSLGERSAWRPVESSDRSPGASLVDRTAGADVEPERRSRVILLGCVKQKRGRRAPAKDLYVSALWRARRAYAEASGEEWLILSAKHGLLDPDEMIAPYDVALADLDVGARGRWGERVVQAPLARYGSVAGMVFEVHAGSAYRLSIAPRLRELGATLVEPLAGLSIGRQLAWYSAHTRAPETARSADVRRQRRVTAAEVRRAMHALDEAPVLVAAIDWPADLPDLNQPGLYSWWVDQPSAEMLSCGLGSPITPGRIYAGQTGATKWPSGKAGAMTLARRIGNNHLSGRIAGSTFRLTLASILAEQLQLRSVGPGQLDRSSEQRLSHWMRDHLQVAVHPFPDRDALADLEQHVLAQLDPPLNLESRPPTPARARLTDLRRHLRAG
jgi:hypothetical protein